MKNLFLKFNELFRNLHGVYNWALTENRHISRFILGRVPKHAHTHTYEGVEHQDCQQGDVTCLVIKGLQGQQYPPPSFLWGLKGVPRVTCEFLKLWFSIRWVVWSEITGGCVSRNTFKRRNAGKYRMPPINCISICGTLYKELTNNKRKKKPWLGDKVIFSTYIFLNKIFFILLQDLC